MTYTWQQLEPTGFLHPRQTVDDIPHHGHVPERWVNYVDFVAKGVRQAPPPAEQRKMFIAMGKGRDGSRQELDAPLIESSQITLQQALQEVFRIAGQDLSVYHRLEAEKKAYVLDGRQDLITQEQMQQALAAMERIHQEHALRTDENIHWFLDQFFRIFEDPEFYIDMRRKQLHASRRRSPPCGFLSAEDLDQW